MAFGRAFASYAEMPVTTRFMRAPWNGLLAQVAICDPPYNVKGEGHISGLGKIVHPDFLMASGEMTDAEFTNFLTDFLRATSDSLVAGRCVVCVYGLAASTRDSRCRTFSRLDAVESMRVEQRHGRNGEPLPLPARTRFRLQEGQRPPQKSRRARKARSLSHQCLELSGAREFRAESRSSSSPIIRR